MSILEQSTYASEQTHLNRNKYSPYRLHERELPRLCCSVSHKKKGKVYGKILMPHITDRKIGESK